MAKKMVKRRLSIQALAKAQGIEYPSALQSKIGGSHETAAMLWEGTVRQLRIETIDKLCYWLNCQPNDLFVEVSEYSYASAKN